MRTGIECAQVRGMTSGAEFEASFIAAGQWDMQFPGVVTVAVTAAVLAIYRKHFKNGHNIDDQKKSEAFRQELGTAVAANPVAFGYDVTDGAHRTKIARQHFPPTVHTH